MSEVSQHALLHTAEWCLSLAVAPTVRPMGQWAEEAIVLPNGPYSGERYRHHRHPVSRLFFEAVDTGLWSRIASTGPTQNGKTLMCYVVPTLYHLFEMNETVIIGLPTMDMANDKWAEDFLPVIEASDYRDLLPTTGEGSRGGMVKRSIKFRNGATLRFMTAGGNDKKRAGYTSRVLAVTETDGMDEASETSREADKIEQLEGRTRAFGRTGKRVYLECTVSIERGRIWQEVKNGTDSRIMRPCPHCHVFVAPEREHLIGWLDAESEEEAAEKATFSCPACAQPWTEQERVEAAKSAVLCHKGQKVTIAGEVVGELPKTQTLGFRWSAIDNPFATAGDLGAEEWLAARARDRESAEKKMRQFVWTLPYEPPEVELTPLDPQNIESRTTEFKKGIVPKDAQAVAVGVDTGKRMLHWSAIVTREAGAGHIVDYGKQPVDADELGVRTALIKALFQLADYLDAGWSSADGRSFVPAQVWIDSGYHEHTDAVYSFCQTRNETIGVERYRPTKGYGEGQRGTKRYATPSARKKNRDIVLIGKEFHIAKVRRNGVAVPGVQLVHVNSDHWKSELHQRLAMPPDESLAVSLFQAASFAEHTEFSQHLVAEVQKEKFIAGRGEVIVWDRVDRNNHWLDASYTALCACEAVTSASRNETKKKSERMTAQQMADAARKKGTSLNVRS